MTGGPIVIVGNPDPVHVGAHLADAAATLGVPVHFCDARKAWEAGGVRRRAEWWLRGHRPARLRLFSRNVVRATRESGSRVIVATGLAPVDREALEELGRLGVWRMNFLTDDPWNPAHRAPWFMDALTGYDIVFTPRRANVDDLRRMGLAVHYLPFGYNPNRHRPDKPSGAVEQARYAADIAFAGGADPDRVKTIEPFVRAGFDVALYGGYWDRYTETRACARGFVDEEGLRHAVGGARVALCLVRRANRDGHAMRTFEVAAMGACMLVEDTPEHREILGPDGEAAVYFGTPGEGVEKLRQLLADDDVRRSLASRVLHRIRRERHTYADRITAMLEMSVLPAPAAANLSS